MSTSSKTRQKANELVYHLGVAYAKDPSMTPGDIFAYLSSLTSSVTLIDLAMNIWDGAQVKEEHPNGQQRKQSHRR